jgi:hypothetical protein
MAAALQHLYKYSTLTSTANQQFGATGGWAIALAKLLGHQRWNMQLQGTVRQLKVGNAMTANVSLAILMLDGWRMVQSRSRPAPEHISWTAPFSNTNI